MRWVAVALGVAVGLSGCAAGGDGSDIAPAPRPNTDHSGDGTGHGPMEAIDRTIPLIFAGPRASAVPIGGASPMDVYPTALAFLGQEPEAAWDLDGRVLLRAIAGPAGARAAAE